MRQPDTVTVPADGAATADAAAETTCRGRRGRCGRRCGGRHSHVHPATPIAGPRPPRR